MATNRLRTATACALPGLLAALVALAGMSELPALWQDPPEGVGECLRGLIELAGAVAGTVPGLVRFAAVWLAAVTAGTAAINLTRLPPAALGGLAPLVAYAGRFAV
jgi:hypothetical protein